MKIGPVDIIELGPVDVINDDIFRVETEALKIKKNKLIFLKKII
jgi:hypothetical protein